MAPLLLTSRETIYDETKETFKPRYKWSGIIFFAIMHVIYFYYIYKAFTDWNFFVTGFFAIYVFAIISNLGVTMGAHRHFAHRSFKVKLPLKLFLLVAHAYTGQNSMFVWVRDHRVHHKFSDTNGDPHNTQRGFFFSHMGWLLMSKHPDVKKLGKTVDMSDLKSDYWVMFQYKHLFELFFLTNLLTFFAMRLMGFSMEMAFAEFVLRYMSGLHFTWSVNSLAHFFGDKPYNKNIRPVENRLVSYLSGGEGWHNYHHTFPWDYKAAEFGNRLNLTARVIDLCAKLGLAYDLKSATPEMVKSFAEIKGDKSHPKDY